MKTGNLILAVISLWVLAGCASPPKPAVVPLQLGMSRADLRMYFGEPLRIEPAAGGGENWYYRFVSWKVHPAYETGVSVESGERTSYFSAGLQLGGETEERPVHVSPDGYVIRPLPAGKIAHK